MAQSRESGTHVFKLIVNKIYVSTMALILKPVVYHGKYLGTWVCTTVYHGTISEGGTQP